MNECAHLPENTFDEKVAKFQCFLHQWPQAAADGIKGTISSGITTVASWAAGIKKWRAVKFAIDALGAWNSATSISKLIGIRRCDPNGRSLFPGRQLQTVDFENLTPDGIYLGTSENGAFHNVPEGDRTFVAFEDGYLRQQTQCVAVSGDDPIVVPITMIPIEALPIEVLPDEGGNDCDAPPCDPDLPSDTTVNVTVSIPGYGTFAPDFVAIGLGTCSDYDGTLPGVYAHFGEVKDPMNSDVFALDLNNDLGPGTWNVGTGPCNTPGVFFSTKDILNKRETFFWPVGFGSYAGSVTLQNYGTTYGERLTGSFNVEVEDSRCLDLECEELEDIRGTISGNFDELVKSQIFRFVRVSGRDFGDG